MENKYNPEFLLGRTTSYFESEGKMSWTFTNDEMAKYEIVIAIKDSTDKFTIRMFEDRVVLLIGKRVKNHEELERNKDNLGAVIVNRGQETSTNYPNYEVFWNVIS